jgi:hypothetical protein
MWQRNDNYNLIYGKNLHTIFKTIYTLSRLSIRSITDNNFFPAVVMHLHYNSCF